MRSIRLFLCFFALTCVGMGQAIPKSVDFRPLILARGWKIGPFLLNNEGTVLLAGGSSQGSYDGLILINGGILTKIVAVGIPVPHMEEYLFAGFSSEDEALALNDRGEVVFSASLVVCESADVLFDCLYSPPFAPRLQGLFSYSDGSIKRLLLEGDPAPHTGGLTFQTFNRIWLNNNDTVLFMASAVSEDQGTLGLFRLVDGQVQKVVLHGEMTPTGEPFSFDTPTTFTLGEDGTITLYSSYDNGLYRFADGAWTTAASLPYGEPAPQGGAFHRFFDQTFNEAGDLAFHGWYGPELPEQGLFVQRRDGRIIRVLTDGERTPLGGVFSLWYPTMAKFGLKSFALVNFRPMLNDSGDLVFTAPVEGGSTEGALFLFSQGQFSKLVSHGDPVPGVEGARLDLLRRSGLEVSYNSEFRFDELSLLASHFVGEAEGEGLFLVSQGEILTVAVSGQTAPGTSGATFSGFNVSRAAFNRSNQGVVTAGLCCSEITQGLFLISPQGPHSIHFPQFADGTDEFGNRVQSQLTLVNPSGTDEVEGEIRIADDDAEPLTIDLDQEIVAGQKTFLIPPGQSLTLTTDGAGPLVQGSLTVDSQGPIKGFIRLEGNVTGEIELGGVQPVDRFSAPVESDSSRGIFTALAVMNLAAAENSPRLELYDLAGSLVGTGTLSRAANPRPLAPGGRMALFLEELSWDAPGPNLSSFQGTLQVESSSGPVSASVLRVDLQQ